MCREMQNAIVRQFGTSGCRQVRLEPANHGALARGGESQNLSSFTQRAWQAANAKAISGTGKVTDSMIQVGLVDHWLGREWVIFYKSRIVGLEYRVGKNK